MNKFGFVKAIADKNGISIWEAYRYVNSVLDMLRVLLADGAKIEIGGFGTFEVLSNLRGMDIPVFKAAKPLKQVLNTKNTNRRKEH